MYDQFSDVSARYEGYVSIVDKLTVQAQTCESVIEMFIQLLVMNAKNHDLYTMKRLLKAMKVVREDILIELSHMQIQKGVLAIKLKQMEQDQA